VSAKLARGSAPPLNIPGVLAAEPLEAGEELCRIPARLHISPPGLRSVAPALCQAVEAAQDLPAARRPEALQALFLAQLLHGAADRAASGGSSEALSGRPQTVELDDGVWGVWERYADVLRGEDFAFHPYRRAAAEPDAMRAALDPSPEADFFIDMARDVRALHQVATETCSAALGRPPPEELFLRARLCMLSRGFKTCQDSTLVPVVDLFNHAQSPGQGASWRWDEQSQAMVVTAVRAHKAGEELFFSYGPRSNLLLYRTYGFTHPPEAEPVWSYIVRPGRVASVYDDFLPGKEPRPQLVLDSENLEASLCEALNAVTRAGRSAAEFLRALCSRCKSPYEEDSRLRPALEALQRARAKDPTSRAWWSELREADRPMAAEDGVRVKMCEYLCLVAHLEALGGGPESPGEGGHLRGTERLRESLGEALEILAAGRDIAVEAVPRAEAS